jgi:uncharacterized membrane protein YhiD involved in acid resistance
MPTATELSHPFDLGQAFGVGAIDSAHIGDVIVRLVMSALLGAILAYRPWRRLFSREPGPRKETAQAQVLIAVAGAIIVAIVGDSLARAFGLVGLGGFIRFRAGIKDPRDAAILFVMIGVGMACGLGFVPIAVVVTVFVGLVLAIFDARSTVRPRRVRVAITVLDPKSALSPLRAAFAGARVIEAPHTSPDKGKVVIEAELGEDADAAAILAMLGDKGVEGILAVKLDED